MSQAQLLENKHHFQVYNRFPITISHGLGCKVWDTEGNEYLDILAGIAVNNLGHSHPKIVAAIKQQAEKLLHVSNFYYTEPQSELVERLTNISGLDRVFLCNSGVEAMEASIKLARKWGHLNNKCGNIISLEGAFHGRSVATISMGKSVYQDGFAPLPNGFVKSPYNDFDALLEKVDDQTIAIAFEPIQGNSGVNIIDSDFIQQVRTLCSEKNILLIMDEIQTGVGRTGEFWAHNHFGITPDIIASAKALGSGVPIGAVIAKEDVANALSHGNHGTTFGGNPFACAVANATLKTIEEENIIAQAYEKGEYFKKQLREKTSHIAAIMDIRGLGLMIGVELNQPARPIVEKLFDHKILSNAAAGNTIRIVPPLIITKEEIDTVVDALVTCLS